ncbi:MAG: hypothetical protein II567_05820 [Candidatus Riflebacteria bacterium]|nr:hypothetical protein [Candidatus Riflebacteria bacterium]
MKKFEKLKRGSAVALCLVFATVLLTMGLAYSKLTMNTKKQTIQIDERVKLEYIANGITELALLKFQLYPADFYACLEAASWSASFGADKDDSPITKFTRKAPEFQVDGDTHSVSSFNAAGVNLQLDEMSIITNSKWKNEILSIKASAHYQDQNGKWINKTVTRLVNLNRNSLVPK